MNRWSAEGSEAQVPVLPHGVPEPLANVERGPTQLTLHSHLDSSVEESRLRDFRMFHVLELVNAFSARSGES